MTTKRDEMPGWIHRLDTRVCMLLIATVAWIAASLVTRSNPAVPQEHDEFSYLLAADTFLEGRLSNPPHPMWTHFETVHVLQQPTYCSKYPPLPGLVLAFGKLVLGDYVRGVWLAFALACAALFWMLDAWVGRTAALVGALCIALHAQIVGFWGTTLWGGALPLLGGALVYGALRRVLATGRASDGLNLGIGAAVLALSRPYEGFVACLPAAGALAWKLVRGTSEERRSIARTIAVPAGLVLAAAGGFLALYNLRTSESATTMAYQVNSQTYEAVPLFLFQDAKPRPEYRHADLEAFYTETVAKPYLARRTWRGWCAGMMDKLVVYWRFFFGIGFAVLAVALPWALREPWMRFAAVACAVFALGLAVETYELPHYAAPLVAVLVALLARCGEILWRRPARNPALVRIAVILCVAAGLTENVRAAVREAWHHPPSPLLDRPLIVDKLARSGGKHLVIVKSSPGDTFSTEWVYNEPDIDRASIVWARSMSEAKNLELLRYFPDRRVWAIDGPDFGPYTGPRPAPRPSGTDR